jgi:hypothetical protein
MGYTTDFSGEFTLNKPLIAEHLAYLEAFSNSRRMKRNATKNALLPDPVREAAGLPVGEDGGYYVGGADDNHGQNHTDDVLDHNTPPEGQPGLWCRWVPNHDGTAIEWDGGEKFYEYTEWICYLIKHFLAPWGYVLNGEVDWFGEDSDDRGRITVTANRVMVSTGKFVFDHSCPAN